MVPPPALVVLRGGMVHTKARMAPAECTPYVGASGGFITASRAAQSPAQDSSRLPAHVEPTPFRNVRREECLEHSSVGMEAQMQQLVHDHVVLESPILV